MEEKHGWYFTFGMSMFHAKDVVVIMGTMQSTRDKMHELFGNWWCSQLKEEDGEDYIRRHNSNIILIEE